MFLAWPGIERRGDLPMAGFNLAKQSYVWKDTTKEHNKHTSSVDIDVILCCECGNLVKYWTLVKIQIHTNKES